MNKRKLKTFCISGLLAVALLTTVLYQTGGSSPPLGGEHTGILRHELEQRALNAKAGDRVIADEAATEASKPMRVFKLVGLMARDKIRESDDAEKYLSEILEPSFDRYCDGEAEYLTEFLDRRSDDLDLGTFKAAPSQKGLNSSLHHLGLSATGSGLLAASDLLVLPRTKLVKEGVAKILGRAGKSLSGKVTLVAGSGTAAVADGPLPLGDTLAVLGLAWTVYDLHDTRARFESELGNALTETFSDIRAEVHGEVIQSIGIEGEPP